MLGRVRGSCWSSLDGSVVLLDGLMLFVRSLLFFLGRVLFFFDRVLLSIVGRLVPFFRDGVWLLL